MAVKTELKLLEVSSPYKRQIRLSQI